MANHRSKIPKQTNTITFSTDAEMELLPFLLNVLSGRSRNSVKFILKRGQVSVDGRVKTKHNYLLTPGQTVSVLKNEAAKKMETLKGVSILHEDDAIIVIRKEAGLLSIASPKETSQTVYKQLMDYVRLDDRKNRIFVVHRLDKETSGVMVFAKQEQIKRKLQGSWSENVRERTYIALVEGKVLKNAGIVTSYLKENQVHKMYSTKDKKNGMYAETTYRLIRQNSDFSLLEVELQTGRKNQIRVHMHDLGHPVVGDKKYGATVNPIKRLGLHASVLGFIHPVTEKYVRFQSKPPVSFMKKVK